MKGRPAELIGGVLLGVALGAAVATAVAGFVLGEIYRPGVRGLPWWETAPWVRRSQHWTSFQGATGYLMQSAAWGSLLAWALARRAPSRQRRVGLIAGSVAVIGSIVTLATRSLVQWDQLALWSVTVGDDVDGYHYAATGEQVRFVSVGGVEVSQDLYARSLWVHLAAPVVAGLVLLAATWVLARPRPAG